MHLAIIGLSLPNIITEGDFYCIIICNAIQNKQIMDNLIFITVWLFVWIWNIISKKLLIEILG